MKFTLKNKATNEILCIGTKQDCMFFIKSNKLDRQNVYFETDKKEQTYHVTVPITEDSPPPSKPFFKRLFNK